MTSCHSTSRSALGIDKKTGNGLSVAGGAVGEIMPEGERLRLPECSLRSGGAMGCRMWNEFIGRRHQSTTNQGANATMALDSKIGRNLIRLNSRVTLFCDLATLHNMNAEEELHLNHSCLYKSH